MSAEGEDLVPRFAGVGSEMGFVSGFDGGIEDIDDVRRRSLAHRPCTAFDRN